MLSIIQLREWSTTAIEELLVESESEGFHFVRRAKEEWLSGANRFSKEGEALFAVFDGARLVAIGGVNRATDSCCRLRRFYVRREERRRGVGRQLLQHGHLDSRWSYAERLARFTQEASHGPLGVAYLVDVETDRKLEFGTLLSAIEQGWKRKEPSEPAAPSGRGSS